MKTEVSRVMYGILLPQKYPWMEMAKGCCFDVRPEAAEDILHIRNNMGALITYHNKKGRKKYSMRTVTDKKDKKMIRVWRIK